MDKVIAQRNKKHASLVITNACNRNCGGCYQLCGHWGSDIWFISEGDFVLSIECLIAHYNLRETPHHWIEVYGGEPTIHPQWDRLLEILYSYEEYPFVVLSNGDTFGKVPHDGCEKFQHIHRRHTGHSKNVSFRLDDKKTIPVFAPTLIAPCDLLGYRVDYWKSAQKVCKMWRECEMVLYRNRAYICGPAAAMDHMFYNGGYGWKITPGEPPFEKDEFQIAAQAASFCHRCRFSVGTISVPLQGLGDKSFATPTNYNAIENRENLELITKQDIHKNPWTQKKTSDG